MDEKQRISTRCELASPEKGRETSQLQKLTMQYIRAKQDRWWVKAQKQLLRVHRAQKRRSYLKKKAVYTTERQREAFSRAAELRYNETPAERKLKADLIQHSIKFIFQHVLFLTKTSYRIADFYLPDYKIVVELDGSYHNLPDIQKYDKFKDAHTNFKVLRFKNEEVFQPDFYQKFIVSLKKPEKINRSKNVPILAPNNQLPISHPIIKKPQPFTRNTGPAFTLQQMKDMKMI